MPNRFIPRLFSSREKSAPRIPPSVKRRFFGGRGKLKLATDWRPGMVFIEEPSVTGGNWIGMVKIKKAYLRRKLAKAAPVSKWRAWKQIDEATVVLVPNFGKVIVKPCLGRDPNRILITLTEMLRRRVRCEIPLGLLEATKYRSYLVTKFFDGPTLKTAMEQATQEERVLMAKLVAKELADLHKKGFVHSHPHFTNWIVIKSRPRLIDATEVMDLQNSPRIKPKEAFARKGVERMFLQTTLNHYGEDVATAFVDEYYKAIEQKAI